MFLLQVYPKWAKMMEGLENKLQFLSRRDRDAVLKLAQERYKEVKEYDILLVAGSLDPEYWDETEMFQGSQDFMRALDNVLGKWYANDEDKLREATEKWAEWREKAHDVAKDANIRLAQNMAPYRWWAM